MKDVKRQKIAILLKNPYLGFFMKDLTFELSDVVERAGIADTVVYLNPEFMAKCSEQEQVAIIAHEVLHRMFFHLPRMLQLEDKYPFELMNVAADHIDNFTLLEMGYVSLASVDGGWVEPKYDTKEWSFELVCADLYKKHKDKEGDFYVPSREDGEKKGKKPQGGSAGDDIIKVPKTKEELEQQVRQWKRDIANAKRMAEHTQGKLPGALQRLVEEAQEPEVNWKQQLWDWVSERTNDETNWKRPNKRFLWQDIYLPSNDGEEMGNLAVAIDTSGSIGQDDLELFAGELDNIRAHLRPRLTTVIYCDAAINKVEEFEPDDEIKLTMVGGGGTDFRPPFEYLDKDGDNVVGLIYMTDMWGQFPDTPPEYPVAWLSIAGISDAPFGKVIPAKGLGG